MIVLCVTRRMEKSTTKRHITWECLQMMSRKHFSNNICCSENVAEFWLYFQSNDCLLISINKFLGWLSKLFKSLFDFPKQNIIKDNEEQNLRFKSQIKFDYETVNKISIKFSQLLSFQTQFTAYFSNNDKKVVQESFQWKFRVNLKATGLLLIQNFFF